MNDLNTIIARNREAARKGIIKGTSAVGAKNTKAVPVRVVDATTKEVITTFASAEDACRVYRQEQKNGQVIIEDIE